MFYGRLGYLFIFLKYVWYKCIKIIEKINDICLNNDKKEVN